MGSCAPDTAGPVLRLQQPDGSLLVAGAGVLSELAALLRPLGRPHVVLVSDPDVADAGLVAAVLEALQPAACPGAALRSIADGGGARLPPGAPGAAVFLLDRVPAGAAGLEPTKTRAQKERLEDFVLSLPGAGRGATLLLAIGGGVVCDVAGFAAATLFRGVPWAAVPTSLLCMVDASVGGKTGVNTAAGKNMIGAFHPAAVTLIDVPWALPSLPHRHFLNGLAEVVKVAALASADLFASLEQQAERLARPADSRATTADWEPIVRLVCEAVRLKASIVAGDLREEAHRRAAAPAPGGSLFREALNFGHTVGHAVEALAAGRLLHGEAVAIGLAAESAIEVHLGPGERRPLAAAAALRIGRLLQGLGLETALPGDLCPEEVLLQMARADKKSAGLLGAGALADGLAPAPAPGAVGPVPDIRVTRLLDIGRAMDGGRAGPVAPGLLGFALSRGACLRRAPGGRADAGPLELRVPGSKSLTNRALLLAAQGRGACVLENALLSEDTQVMLRAINGGLFDEHPPEGGLLRREAIWQEDGSLRVSTRHEPGPGPAPTRSLYVANAGTAARFLTGYLALNAATGQAGRVSLRGSARMHVRPIGDLTAALAANGADIGAAGSPGCLPVDIARGSASGGAMAVRADISSQYTSAILLAAPFARAPVTLRLLARKGAGADLACGRVTSQPYIDMTVDVMRAFGLEAHSLPEDELPGPGVPADQEARLGYEVSRAAPGHTNPSSYAVACDASSSTYPLAVAALLPAGRAVTVRGVGARDIPWQGDAGFCHLLARMGCAVDQTADMTTVTSTGQLIGVSADMSGMTDAFMTAAVVMAAARGRSTITGIANQRVKECDRIAATARELRRCGVQVSELPDGLVIEGADLLAPLADRATGPIFIHCYDDHRMAMSFAVLAAVLPSIVIMDKECVQKTYPTFWGDMRALGMVFDAPASLPAEAPEPGMLPVGEAPAAGPPAAGGYHVLLVGMRGAGKTTRGRLAAGLLACPFFDLDELLARTLAGGAPEPGDSEEAVAARTRAALRALVHAEGMEGFRRREAALLAGHRRWLLARGDEAPGVSPVLSISACGGGLVDWAASRQQLTEMLQDARIRVVFIDRDLRDIEALLQAEAPGPGADGRVDLGEAPGVTYRRRLPHYLGLSHAVYPARGPACAGPADDAAHFAGFLAGLSPARPPGNALLHVGDLRPEVVPRAVAAMGARAAVHRGHSAFLTLTLADYRAPVPHAADFGLVFSGADAVELRLDCVPGLAAPEPCRCRPGPAYGPCYGAGPGAGCLLAMVSEQVAACRALLAAHGAGAMPLIATLRTARQGGAFAGSTDQALAVLQHCARLGCQFLDVEMAPGDYGLLAGVCPLQGVLPFRVIASFHTTDPGFDLSQAEALVAGLPTELFGRLFAVKVVAPGVAPLRTREFRQRVLRAVDARARLAGQAYAPLSVVVETGPAGRHSRVLQRLCLPVTHRLLAAPGAPGQLCLRTVNTLRRDLQHCRMAVVGSRVLVPAPAGAPVAGSLSPAMHQAGLDEIGLAGRTFEAINVDSVDGLWPAIEGEEPVTRLAVTMPLKRDAVRHCAGGLSPEARLIGAVNTLVRAAGKRAPGAGEALWTGDNTDWLGVARVVGPILARAWSRRLTERLVPEAAGHVAIEPGAAGPRLTVVVLGAGGSARAALFALCFALALPLDVLVWSRGLDTGDPGDRSTEALLGDLLDWRPDGRQPWAPAPGVRLRILRSAESPAGPVDLLVNTLPPGAFAEAPGAGGRVRALVRGLARAGTGALVDLVYNAGRFAGDPAGQPGDTPLMGLLRQEGPAYRAAERLSATDPEARRCLGQRLLPQAAGPGAPVFIDGTLPLLEQGISQFQLFNGGLRAPRCAMLGGLAAGLAGQR